MRSKIWAVFGTLVFIAPVHAKNDQVERGPIPSWVRESELIAVPEDASGLLFIRRQDTLVHLDQKGQTQHLGYRIKILHPNALQLGNLSIAWNPAAGAPTVHSIKIHREGQAIDVLEDASFDILRREDQLEAARLDGVLTAVLRVADLRVGDELEFAVTIPMSDPTLGASNAGLLMLGAEPPAGRFRLGLSWEEGQKPQLKFATWMEAAAKRYERGVEFRFDNPPTLNPPKDAPPRFQWQRVVEYSGFKDWAAISRHFSPLFQKAAKLEPGSPLREEARRISAAHSTSLDRANAALKLVQQQVRYVYVGLDGGNLTPASAEETWQRRYGDCKAKTALLLALLSELSIEAEAVLANNGGLDDGFEERLPNPGLFDHVLVRAQIDGVGYWLDGTLPPVAAANPIPTLPYRWVLPLSLEGRSLERIEWKPSEIPDEITLHEIDAREGFEQPARIVNTTITRGIKGLQQQVQFSGLTPAQLLAGLRQQLVGSTWQEIVDVKWRYDSRAQASVLTISGKGTVTWDDDGDGAKSLSLPGGGFIPPEKRVRATDQDQRVPYYREPGFNCHVTTVRLPRSTSPEQWSFNSQFKTRFFGQHYYRAFDLHDHAIRMVRGSRIEQREIDPDAADRDNARLSAFDNSMAWIYYAPRGASRGKAPVEKDLRVPATYEIEWTADQVPCLSSPAGE